MSDYRKWCRMIRGNVVGGHSMEVHNLVCFFIDHALSKARSNLLINRNIDHEGSMGGVSSSMKAVSLLSANPLSA